MKRILLTLALIVFSGCAPESNIKPTIDRVNQPIEVTVVFHDSQESLELAYREVHNLDSKTFVPEQWGFAVWNEWRDRDGNTVDITLSPFNCTIHTTKPMYQEDQSVLTMGHELLHCVYGSYHN